VSERVCFELQVRPECIEEYRRRHAAVWPEMLEALRSTGWRHYSLFLRPDGLLIGYFETEDLQASLDAMAATEVNRRWQAEMAPLFADPSRTPEHGLVRLDEVFNLDAQLTRLA
jgi:L-rhamnose mutarotase